MATVYVPSLVLLLLSLYIITGCARRPFYPLPSKQINNHRQPIQTIQPYNIAHRGSNGELPEETTAAYMRAIEEGADFIESDVLATKDGALICFHDVTLNDITDVYKHKEFSSRIRTYEVQGVNITGWFTVDFTLAEIKHLRVNQRYKFRDQSYNERKKIIHSTLVELPASAAPIVENPRDSFSKLSTKGKFSIITFEEFISIALDAPRMVGIYPEIKNPVFINQHVKWSNAKTFEDKFVETLLKYGYGGKYLSTEWIKQPIFIQSFAPTSLVHASQLIDSPKILLIDDVTVPTQDTNQSYWEITSDGYLDYIREYVVGIGPWKETIVPQNSKNYLSTPSNLVAKAHAHDLQVHPYTYRNEYMFLPFNFHQDPYAEYDYWIKMIGVDGLFTDFTGSLHNYQEWDSSTNSHEDVSALNLLHKIARMILSFKQT